MAVVITYWQLSIRLAPSVGVCAEAAVLPQDEATAAVVLGAILARNFGTRWPGMYRAQVDTHADSEPVTVVEADARVALARSLLTRTSANGQPSYEDFTASRLARVREAVLVAARDGSSRLAVPDRDREAAGAAAGRTASGSLLADVVPGVPTPPVHPAPRPALSVAEER